MSLNLLVFIQEITYLIPSRITCLTKGCVICKKSRVGCNKVRVGVSQVEISRKSLDTFVNDDKVMYFGSFVAEYMPRQLKMFIDNKNLKNKIYRIIAYDLIMCVYICIGFIDFMLNGKSLKVFSKLA